MRPNIGGRGSFVMPLGKYGGKPLVDVPSWYLDWLAERDWIDNYPDLCDAMNDEMEWRKDQENEFLSHFHKPPLRHL